MRPLYVTYAILLLLTAAVSAQNGFVGPDRGDTLFNSADDMYPDSARRQVRESGGDSLHMQGLHVVERNHDFEKQIRYSLFTMIFVFIMMSTAQTFNPR